MKPLQLICMALLLLFSCKSEHKEKPSNQSDPDLEADGEIDNGSDSNETPMPDNSAPLDSFEMDNGPPFKYPCESSFQYIGVVKFSNSHWEEIQIGKGWDSRRHSCTFVWGEHIYNNLPPDSIVQFKMHLVDLDSSQVELTPEFLKSSLFKNHLIVTSINTKEDLKTIWDPHRTGKYPKPKHWME